MLLKNLLQDLVFHVLYGIEQNLNNLLELTYLNKFSNHFLSDFVHQNLNHLIDLFLNKEFGFEKKINIFNSLM